MSKFGFYVPSYHRAYDTTTYKILPYVTYVVRKSEKDLYKKNGIPKIIAVEDELIDSFEDVHNWLIEAKQIKEDVICVIDDDVTGFMYRIGYHVTKIDDPYLVKEEIERILQQMVDLEIGYGGLSQTASPYNYNSEISFNSLTGSVRFMNRKVIKARFVEMDYFADLDFVMQELQQNRIIFRPNYLCTTQGLETNRGGNNDNRATRDRAKTYNEIIKPKWGKYFQYDVKRNVPKILIMR